MTLPEGWALARVNEVGTVQLGRQRSPDVHTGPNMRPYLRVANVFEGRIDASDVMSMHFEEHEYERFKLCPGDILLNEGQSRELVGRPAIYNDETPGAAFTNSLVRFKAKPHLLTKYAFEVFRYYLYSGEFMRISKWTTNIAHLGAGRFAEMNFPLPPLNEQRRIVDKIEALTARSRRAKEALDAVPALLDKLRQSILAAAFRGDLTKEWRAAHPDVEPASVLLDRIRKERRARWEEAELAKMRAKGSLPKDDKWKSKYVEPEPVNTDDLPELPEGWAYARLPQLLSLDRAGMKTGPFGTLLSKADHRDVGVPVIGIENIGAMEFIHGSKVHLDEAKASQLTEYDALPGDLIVSRSGTVGEVCVIPSTVLSARLSTNTIRVSLHPAVAPPLIGYGLSRDPFVLRQVHEQCAGSTRDFLNQGIMSELVLRIPPMSETTVILEALTSSLAYVSKLEAAVSLETGRVANLNSAILAKAFRGELVPQDPNDEPASALLERIRAERESGVTTSPTKKTRTKRTEQATAAPVRRKRASPA